jgi:hypothetical protein
LWSVQPVKNCVLCPSYPVIWLRFPLFTNTTVGIQTNTSYSIGHSPHLNTPSLPSSRNDSLPKLNISVSAQKSIAFNL